MEGRKRGASPPENVRPGKFKLSIDAPAPSQKEEVVRAESGPAVFPISTKTATDKPLIFNSSTTDVRLSSHFKRQMDQARIPHMDRTLIATPRSFVIIR